MSQSCFQAKVRLTESVLEGEPTKRRQAAVFFRYQSSHETQLLSISGHKPQALQFTRRLVFFRATEEMMEDYYAREGGMSNWSKTDKM